MGAAIALLNGGDLRAAEAAGTALRRMAPADPAVLQLAAEVALRAGRLAEAQADAGRCVALRPGHGPSLLLAARVAMAAGTPDRAVRLLHGLPGDHPEAAFLLCHACLAAGDAGLGPAMARLARHHGAEAARWLDWALGLQRAGRDADALAAFTQAASADPGLAGAHLGRGLLLHRAGRPAEAERALLRAAELDPDQSGTWFALGLARQELGREAEAAAAYEAALARRPDFAEAAVNLGTARQALGDMDAALAAYRVAYGVRPEALGRIAQAVTAARAGVLWIDPAGLRRALGG